MGCGMGWMMLWMGLASLVGLVLVIVGAAVAVRWLSAPSRGAAAGSDPALHEARMRLARGELSPEEYDRIVAKLREGERRGG